MEARIRKFKNEKVAGKDEASGEMIKGLGDIVDDWVWRLRNMAIERAVVPEDWISAVIRKLWLKNIYRGTSRVIEGLTGDEQGCFRSGRRCVDQIFPLNQIGEKVRVKKCRVYVGLMD